MTDDSGFFAVGLLMYQYFRGRRDGMLYGMFALSVSTAIFQAIHNLDRLSVHTGGTFDKRVVTAICIASLVAIFVAIRIRRVPLPTGLVLALGGITYPLYLLHMQLGYVIFKAAALDRDVEIVTAAIIGGTIILAWGAWRFFERAAHRRTKEVITSFSERIVSLLAVRYQIRHDF